LGAWHRVVKVAEEYISFIALIGSLFVVAGGIHINVKGEATPLVKTVFLLIGAVIANVLGTTLGPLLIQLSPEFHPSWANRDALRAFLELLPIRHRWAVEVRHAGWLDGETLDLLRSRGVALALADGRWIKRAMVQELAIEPTADFGYVRWMGEQRRITDFSHVQRDREDEMATWRDVLESLASRVRTVYGYFNNQYQGHSPQSARSMQGLLGQTAVAPELLQEQVELF
jgi:uncharacterized protein YecE (DUF72 family)